jgi:cytochrome c oxidase subunit 2
MSPLAAWRLDPKGPVAETIAGLWWLMLALGVAVFAVFLVLLARGLFGAKRTGERDPAADGARLSRRWVLGGGVLMPTAVLVGVFAATLYAMRAMPTRQPRDALVVDVIGHQWWYEVRYRGEGFTTRDEMHIPVGRPVALYLTSVDVIHSFWVPELGGKMDMLPDGTNLLVLEAGEAGRYQARCAEFCGLHHTEMKLAVVAEPADRFAAWLAEQR